MNVHHGQGRKDRFFIGQKAARLYESSVCPSVVNDQETTAIGKLLLRQPLAATAALFAPPAHSRMMRARKARDRELPGGRSSCRKVISCSGLTTSSCFGGVLVVSTLSTKTPLRHLHKPFMTPQTGWAFPNSRGGPRSVRCPTAEWVRNSRCRAPGAGELRFRLGLRRGRAGLVLRSSHD